MKKIFTLTIALLAMLAVNAQVLLSEGFESGTLPSGWTVLDNDGDSYTWDATYLYQESPSQAHTGGGMISSASYIEGVALTPDNWLITPAVNLTSYATLSFWICAQDSYYADEHYGIYISTTSIDISDFTLLYEETIDANGGTTQGAWMQKTVDLSSYIGQTIYIAFRHFNCTDQLALNLDDVKIVAPCMTEGTITVSPSSLDFGYVAMGSTSAVQTILLTNFNLTTDVTVTTAVPFEVSSDGIIFGTTALIPSEGGTLYLRYTPITPNYNIGTLTLSSTCASDVTIPLSGFGIGNYSQIVYVTPTGAGTHSGNSWANATSSIDTAQTLAQTHNAVVWVAAGIYYGNTSSDNAFTMIDGVNVFGGFAGNEPANYDLSQRDFESNASILDGQHSRRVLYQQPYNFEHMVIGSTWDGFTIRNGNSGYASGVLLEYENGAINHCLIHNNSEGGVMMDYGVISNCHIYNNSTTGVGGGIIADHNSIVYNCHIYNNSATGYGGGIFATNSCSVSNCHVYSNTANIAGGFYGGGTVSNCQIYNNTALSSYGGVQIGGGTLSNCMIYNNTGLGVWASGSHVSNCYIYNNDGVGLAADGSGTRVSNCQIHHNSYDGLWLSQGVIASNCLIYNNNDGGVTSVGSNTIVNSTIVRNSSSLNGSGVRSSGFNSLTMANCIVWGNTGPVGSYNVKGNVTCSHSAIEGGFLGTNNVLLSESIQQFPLFVNPSLTAGADDTTSNVDWHLLPGSPCINRGDNAAVIDSLDMDGHPRVKRYTVDMGCYESNNDSSPIITPEYTNIIYVTPSGAGNHTGDSWANATSSISFALSIADVYNAEDIWVAAGTYYGDTTSTDAFTMIKGVNVYGGFAGNEPEDYDLSLRDFEANATILDGQQARRVLNQPSNFNTSTTWDGFTIQNGRVTGLDAAGGGAYLRKNGVLSHCQVSNNAANATDASQSYGGGVYAMASSSISYCQISNNSASTFGGGVYADNSIISDCQIINNTANSCGGGIAAHDCSIINCQIINNTAIAGGGIYGGNTISQCRIFNNSASYQGGGIHGAGIVLNSQIFNNTSSESGGGIYSEGGWFSDCQIFNNTANTSGGGVVSNGSFIINCLISNNSASEYGGGVWAEYEAGTIYNSTIVRNVASLSGGGVYTDDMVWNGLITMTNCIVWGNESDSSKNVQNVSCSYSAIEDGCEGDSIITLSSLNPPYFVNPSLTAGAADSTPNVDWHLQQGSVCINRGNNNAVMDSLDLDGLARIQRDTVDLGCYESDYYSSPLSECVTQFSELTETACDSYVWNDSIYTQTGDYTQTLTDVYGCDSVVTVHLTVFQSAHNAETITACDSYDWHGGLYDTSGVYIYEYTNMDGCPSTDTLYLTINYSTNSIDEHVACVSFTWMDGVTYTESTNTPTYTITNAVSCDSIITLHLTIKPSVTEDFEVVICDSYSWNDSVYTQSGDYTQTFTAANGCDSVVTLHLTINNSIATEFSDSTCDSYAWNDSVYTQSGDYTQAFETVHGCDSVVTLHLTINTSDHTDLTAAACGQYVWLDSTYTESGNYSVTYTNSAGCDSIVTLHLTINPIPEVAITGDTTICPGGGTQLTATGADSYVWSNYSTNASIPVNMFGVYSVTGTTSAGCYNTATVTVLVAQPPVITVTGDLELCAGETGTITAHGGTTYMWSNGSTDSTLAVSSAGTWQVIGYDENGCNGMASATVTVWQPVTTQFTITVNDSCYVWNTVSYCESGNYTQSFQTVHGCDSVVTLHLVLTTTVYEDIYETACDSYTWNNATYSQSGNYVQTFTLADGSDSVVTLHLTIFSLDHTDLYVSECESYTWNGTTYSESGDYMQTFMNSNGCDSVVTLHLTIYNPVHTALTEAACGSYEWNGTTYTESGNYTYSHTDANGCTQVDTLHLTINYSSTGDTTAVSCESFTWEGETYTQSGDYTSYLTNAAGCDSVLTLHLTINQPTTGDTTATACESFTWEGETYTQSGDYTSYLTNAAGCDSVLTLHLTINQPTTGDTTATACESFTWEGETYTQSGDYTSYLTNTAGCDSIVTLHLTIYENTTSEFTITTDEPCYTWNNIDYCESGDYTQTLQTVHGCDSVVTLHLTITVGINDYETVDFKVFPNPTNGILNVECTMNNVQFSAAEIHVVDMYGKLVRIQTFGDESTHIDISDLASGVYFVKLVAEDKTIAVRKVVKQ